MSTVTVALPMHLRRLVGLNDEVRIEVDGPASPSTVLDALEARYPALRGTIREHRTRKRRPYLRYFAAGEDISHDDPDLPLHPSIVSGDEPFIVIGAISGG